MTMALETNSTVSTNGNGTVAFSASFPMPLNFFRWVHQEDALRRNEIHITGKDEIDVIAWVDQCSHEELSKIEASLKPVQRRNFHLALIWTVGAERALGVIWATTIQRMMGVEVMPKVNELLLPYRRGDQTTVQILESVLAQNKVLQEVNKLLGAEQGQIAQERAELEVLSRNLSARIAAWNEERKMAEIELETDGQCQEELDDLHSRCAMLDYENTLLRELLKTLL